MTANQDPNRTTNASNPSTPNSDAAAASSPTSHAAANLPAHRTDTEGAPDALPSATTGDDWVTVGEIVGAFGLHGELKVHPLTDFPARFSTTPTLYVGPQHVPYAVTNAHPHKQHVLVQLAGVTDITSAERLRGSRVAIPATQVQPLAADQFYLHDVIGLRVRHVDGRDLGTVTDVLTTGANDLFVVRDAERGTEVLLPVVKAFIVSVDVGAGVVTVDPIPGLFDDAYDDAP